MRARLTVNDPVERLAAAQAVDEVRHGRIDARRRVNSVAGRVRDQPTDGHYERVSDE